MALPAPIQALDAGWQALYAAARTHNQRALVETIAARALRDHGPAASVDSIPELARDDEIDPLGKFLDQLFAKVQQTADPYQLHKQRTAEAQRTKSADGREIGPLPPVADPERRAACERDLSLYLPTYHPRAFPKPFCAKQLRMIQRLNVACLIGALYAFAIDRGCGKTTIAIRTVVWSQLYRHHTFAMILGANDEKGQKAMVAIRTELRFNPLLLADFPEVCYPIYRLEGINQRAKGQTLDGAPTLIEITDNQILLPTVAGVPGCIIGAGGLLTAVRGAQHTTPTGEIIRPGFVVIDDPQTRESARSREQTQTRLDIILGDVLGMAGPGEPIAVAVPCTIIEPGDAADVLTDRTKSPEWQGQREGIVDKLPDRLDLWNDYFELLDRIRDISEDDAHTLETVRAEATAFYVERREDMDRGCNATWPERFLPWEASAVQHAMNLFHRDEAAFWSEYMNQPLDPFAAEDEFLTAAEIAERFSGYNRYAVPLNCQWITTGIDVQKRCLYYVTAAWESTFTGYVIDYGVFPEQQRRRWKAAQAERTLRQVYPKRSAEAATYAGLQQLYADLIPKPFKRIDDVELQHALALTDAGDQTETVRKAIRESDHRGRMLWSFGRSLGPNQSPISAYKQKAGERIGPEWMIRPGRGRTGRHLLADVDFWKTFVHRRLATPAGDRGSLTLYGRKAARPHSFFAEQLTSEKRDRIVGNRPVDKWTLRPGHSENHWLDALVLAAVAASVCGAQLTGITSNTTRRRGTRQAEYLTP